MGHGGRHGSYTPEELTWVILPRRLLLEHPFHRVPVLRTEGLRVGPDRARPLDALHHLGHGGGGGEGGLEFESLISHI